MQTTTELNTEVSWEHAREYAKSLAKSPNVFAAAVRLLISDYQKRGGEMRPVTKYMVSHALRGKKILAMLYYAAQRLRNDQVKDKENLSLGELVNLYEPYDLAAIYTTFLLYRRVRAQLKLDREGFFKLIPGFRVESQLGACVGAAIPKIGVGNGALCGAIHHLAQGVIAITHPQRVEAYQKHLVSRNLRMDPIAENDIFGCGTAQVGSLLLARFGFSNAAVDPYFRGMEPKLKTDGAFSNSSNPVRFGRLWLDAVLDTKDQPLEAVPGEFYPTSAARDWLQEQLTLSQSGEISWFERDQDDVSPSKTPPLFTDKAKSRDVPEQLADIFTLKEISEMSEKEFDELVDEIDQNITDGTIDEKLSKSEVDADG